MISLVGDTATESHFTKEENSIISKYGFWFEAIWAGQVPLTTERLKRFKRAKDLPPEERNKFEDLWVRFNQSATSASGIANKFEDKSHTAISSKQTTKEQTVKRVEDPPKSNVIRCREADTYVGAIVAIITGAGFFIGMMSVGIVVMPIVMLLQMVYMLYLFLLIPRF